MNRRKTWRIAFAALWLAMTGTLWAQVNGTNVNAAAASAANENADNEAQRKEFDAAFPPGKQVCFMRSYDRAQLAQHRTQTLRTITIGHRNADMRIERLSDRDGVHWRQANPEGRSSVVRYLYVSANFRRDRRHYADRIVCDGTSDGHISCRTDGCDTADQRIYIKTDGPRHILAWPNGVRLRGTCGDDAPSRSITASDHDGPIRLERAPMAACLKR